MRSKITNQLETVTQETRRTILECIVAHPENAPSLAEVNYYVRNKSKSTVRNHLDRLIEDEVVAKIKLPEDERTRDDPSVFYVLTRDGWRVLNQHAIIVDHADELGNEYANLEKFDRVRRFEDAPRPDLSPADQLYVENDQ